MSEKPGYVISDLHIGAAKESQGLDSFTQDDAFVHFVEEITAPGTTLFINGDFVDFAQIPPYDHPDQPSYLLWTEAVSCKKLTGALAGHPRCFEALRAFLDAGGTLSICVGNHDLDWAWPEVQRAFRRALGNPPAERLRFAVDHPEVYEGVHIEHGHSFTPENCPVQVWSFIHRWPDEPGGKEYLERVWGTDFMLHWWNGIKQQYPYADCVKPTAQFVFQGPIGMRERAKALWQLVVFLRGRGIPWRAIAEATLAEPEGADPFDLLLSVLAREDADALEELAGRVPELEDAVRSAYEDLSPTERTILGVTTEKVVLPHLGPQADDVKTLGIFRPPPERRKAAEILGHAGITHVVFGHTHAQVDGNAPGTDLHGCWFNTGTWLPFLNLNRADVKAKIKAKGITFEMLKDKRLYDVSLCAVRIRPNAPNRAAVELIRVA
jgi:UDP-2,3-diacylglucosamine pyrophosphatase LpxH